MSTRPSNARRLGKNDDENAVPGVSSGTAAHRFSRRAWRLIICRAALGHRLCHLINNGLARGASTRLAGPLELDYVQALVSAHDALQSLVPSAQRMGFAVDHVGADILTGRSSSLVAARLVTDHGGCEIKRHPHFRQHGRHRTPQIMRGEFLDR